MRDAATSRPLRALVANHESWWVQSLASVLTPNGYSIIRAHTGLEAIERAEADQPDVIILDAGLPDMSITDLCRKLTEDPLVSLNTPVLITATGDWSRVNRIQALAAGAWDSLTLPMDTEELLLRLQVLVRAKVESDRAREQGLIDTATGVYNPTGIIERARELWCAAFRLRKPLACIALAPDSRPEDASHPNASPDFAGTVRQIARVLKSTARLCDPIGRRHGAEFLILAPFTDDAGAVQLTRRLTAAIEQAATVDPDWNVPALSMGYHAVPNVRESGIGPEILLARATHALSGRRNGGSDAHGEPPSPNGR